MRQISHNLYLHQDTCNVYIIRTGAEAVLVDFGDGSVLDRLAEIGVERVTDILMTHHHRDAAQGLHRAAAAGARVRVPHQEQDLFHSVDHHWRGREVLNSYNNRQDRFSLLEPVAVTDTLQDYATLTLGAHSYTVLPTPGHTTGSVSLLAEIDGELVAFTGDLIYAPGKVWSLAATQWSYNGGEGIPGTILSLLDLKDRQPAMLFPAHGEVMTDVPGAIDLTVERLAALRTLRGQNPRLFLLRENPYEQITEHLLRNRTSMSDAYVLLSRSGKALLIDFGYDFMFGTAYGQDRASRRPWLYNIPALKRQFGVTKIDVVLPTHYHDDHVAGFNLLRQAEGAQVWCPDRFASVLERPADYDIPCLWYDPIPVDRLLYEGKPFQWEEYEFTIYPLPGHTYWAVAIAFAVDGKRVLVTGDQQEHSGQKPFLNYVYKNGFRPWDYRESAELYLQLKPDLILTGHWGVKQVEPGFLESLLERGTELERLHRELLPDETAQFAAPELPGSDSVASVHPYQVLTRPHEPVSLGITLRNPFDRPEEAEVRLALPEGWRASPEAARVRLQPKGSGEVAFTVTPPRFTHVYRARIAAEVTVGGRRFGQQAEALITVR